MEKEKGFIHADIEDKDESVDVFVTIKNLDIFMAAAGLKGILDALSEHDKVAALLVWAKASCDAFGYKSAAAALSANKKTEEEGENGDE